MDQVMRLLLGTLALLAMGDAQAQSWCPPGATWHHTYTNHWTHTGYTRYTYTSDTLVGGVMAQRIEQYVEGTAYGEPFAVTMTEAVLTSVQGDLVSIWNGQGFDTLFHFGAIPGDVWRLAPSLTPTAVITVTDTGTMIINGLPLRFIVTGNDTIVERLGALDRVLPPWPIVTLDASNGALRCYSDDDIQFQAPSWGYGCASYTSVLAHGVDAVSLFPNPGTTHFTLQLPPGAHTITLFDATGRMVLEQRTADERPVIGTEHLPAGMYRITVRDERGAVMGATWVKER